MSNRPKDCCKDCWEEWIASPLAGATLPMRKPRPAPHPGPRCATHWRAERKRRALVVHESNMGKLYGLLPGQYESLYNSQLNTCAICLRATGKTKRLAVDHDHATGKVRGLLCGPCNSMIAHSRDSYMFFYRAARYLQEPPADKVLRDE